jgi:hypothetical protein
MCYMVCVSVLGKCGVWYVCAMNVCECVCVCVCVYVVCMVYVVYVYVCAQCVYVCCMCIVWCVLCCVQMCVYVCCMCIVCKCVCMYVVCVLCGVCCVVCKCVCMVCMLYVWVCYVGVCVLCVICVLCTLCVCDMCAVCSVCVWYVCSVCVVWYCCVFASLCVYVWCSVYVWCVCCVCVHVCICVYEQTNNSLNYSSACEERVWQQSKMGLQLSLMTCTWLPHTPENKPRPLWELRRCTMMQDRTIWPVMILANGLLLRGLGWWGVVGGLYKGLRLGEENFSWREIPACMLKGSWINCFEKSAVLSLFSAGRKQKRHLPIKHQRPSRLWQPSPMLSSDTCHCALLSHTCAGLWTQLLTLMQRGLY